MALKPFTIPPFVLRDGSCKRSHYKTKGYSTYPWQKVSDGVRPEMIRHLPCKLMETLMQRRSPFVRSPEGWQLSDRLATPESVYFDRRSLLKRIGGSLLIPPASLRLFLAASDPALAQESAAPLPNGTRNPIYTLDRPVTEESLATSYNNFYEFGSSKNIKDEAAALPLRPWEVRIDGLVETPLTLGIDDLLAKMPMEERLYRHRCVETWSMAVPWFGFPLKALLDLAGPLGSARYLVMRSFTDSENAPGQRAVWYPWPYLEGLTLAEASHDLAFLAIGLYGKILPPQNGAPLRLVVPWKYGFKSIKSIVHFTLSETRPTSFWQSLQPAEYGFWANVNPDVPHPRWSQKTELPLGSDERTPTLLFNGYAEFVSDLYRGLEAEPLFQ